MGQGNAKEQWCINPPAMDPELLECDCYKKLTTEGGCDDHTSAMEQAKCLQCQICKADAKGKWALPLCASWKKAVCQTAHLGAQCKHTGGPHLLEENNEANITKAVAT